MHLIDLNLTTAIITYLGAAAVCTYAYQLIKRRGLREVQIPILGVGTVFIFLLQLITFSLPGGLRGHFYGLLLLSTMLGPWLVCLVAAAIILIQTVLFSQGGLPALGSNILNIAVIGGIGGYYLLNAVKSFFKPHQPKGFLVAIAISSWVSYMLSIMAADLALILSDQTINQFGLFFSASLLGAGEALITTAMVALFLVARPDLIVSFCCGSNKDVCYDETHHKHTHHHH